jgi:hypothetical protein
MRIIDRWRRVRMITAPLKSRKKTVDIEFLGVAGSYGEPAGPGQDALETLLRDPSLLRNEQLGRFLRLLERNAVGPQEWSDLIAAVPPDYADLVAQLARQYSQRWLSLAQELNEGMPDTDPRDTDPAG